jgi:hypothetical protein
MRVGIFLIVLVSVGCVSFKPLPRWLVLSDPRVEIGLNDNATTAVLGDSVYIEVGHIELDPDSKSYVVCVDGRRVAHPEWDIKDADLRYRYRAKKTGTYTIELTIPREKGEPARRTVLVNVVE